jgi:hypothetical protein
MLVDGLFGGAMPKSRVFHDAHQHRPPAGRVTRRNVLEGQIEEICRDMAMQVKRTRQLHEQADELRTAFRQWTQSTSER